MRFANLPAKTVVELVPVKVSYLAILYYQYSVQCCSA